MLFFSFPLGRSAAGLDFGLGAFDSSRVFGPHFVPMEKSSLTRLRWWVSKTHYRLKRCCTPLQFGYSVWRTTRTNAEAHNFQTTTPTLAQLNGPGFFRANAAPVMPAAEMDLGAALGGAENPADRITYFFADTGRATATAFGDGEEFYYFITARDILD